MPVEIAVQSPICNIYEKYNVLDKLKQREVNYDLYDIIKIFLKVIRQAAADLCRTLWIIQLDMWITNRKVQRIGAKKNTNRNILIKYYDSSPSHGVKRHSVISN